MSLTIPTPELDKMRKVQKESQTIGAFLDECGYSGVVLCRPVGKDGWGSGFEPVPESIEQLLAQYFDIDLKKVEQEKRAILRAIQAEVPLR